MTYSEDIRKLAMEYHDNEVCVQKIAKILKISRQTLYTWINKRKIEGELKFGYLGNKNAQKIDVNRIKKVVSENPDLYLREIAKLEDVTPQAIFYCL